MEGLNYRYGKMRFWEMLPGVLVWLTFALAIGLSFIAPFWAIVFIIIFDLYWLYRVIYFVIYLSLAWKKHKEAIRVDWMVKLDGLSRASEVYHLVFLPTYQEPYDIIQTTLRTLGEGSYPTSRMIIVLAGEERDGENFRRNAQLAQQEFGSQFKDIFVTEHPMNLPDEIPGKGSNLNWSGTRVAELLAARYPEIADENLIVSSFDVDTIAHPQYFANLTYLYCTVPNPERSSYQPVALYSNNIWTVPAPVRVAAFGTTFWLMGELARPDRLWTFSSHSMPWKMVKDVGFWQKDIVSEDSRIFMQGLIHYRGNYRVTPIYLPVSMDTVTGENYWDAMKALYKQLRRWAWGVEHLPIMVEAFKKDDTMKKRTKAKYLFNHIEGMYTWATAPMLIFILGWLPLQLTNDGHALVQAAPFTLETLMRLAMIGVFATGILALTLLPPRPKHVKQRAWAVMILQWALLPITFVIFGAVPAIDAQTRLMVGNYLGFNVTKKARE